MKFRILRNLVGDKINYIARDARGVVRIREATLKKMEAAIAEFNKREEAERIESGAERFEKKGAKGRPEAKEETSVESVVEVKEEAKPSAAKSSGKKRVARGERAPQKKFYGYRRGK